MTFFSPVKFLVTLLWAGVSAGGLGAMDLQTLVDRSPFSPPKSAVAENGTQEQPGTLEFRGMVVDEAGTSYSVFDATASRGYWVREGGDGPIRVTSFDAGGGVLEIEQNGKPVKLSLKQATIAAGSAAPVATATAARGRDGRPSRAGASADQADRMAKIAEQVRKTRATRLAAQESGKKAPAPVPTPGF